MSTAERPAGAFTTLIRRAAATAGSAAPLHSSQRLRSMLPRHLPPVRMQVRQCQKPPMFLSVLRSSSGGGKRRLYMYERPVQTTERYLGTKRDLVHAPNDGIKLRVAV